MQTQSYAVPELEVFEPSTIIFSFWQISSNNCSAMLALSICYLLHRPTHQDQRAAAAMRYSARYVIWDILSVLGCLGLRSCFMGAVIESKASWSSFAALLCLGSGCGVLIFAVSYSQS
jgi:hypothetical protein